MCLLFPHQLQGFDTEPGTQSWIFCVPNSIPIRGRSAQAAQVMHRSSRTDLIKGLFSRRSE